MRDLLQMSKKLMWTSEALWIIIILELFHFRNKLWIKNKSFVNQPQTSSLEAYFIEFYESTQQVRFLKAAVNFLHLADLVISFPFSQVNVKVGDFLWSLTHFDVAPFFFVILSIFFWHLQGSLLSGSSEISQTFLRSFLAYCFSLRQEFVTISSFATSPLSSRQKNRISTDFLDSMERHSTPPLPPKFLTIFDEIGQLHGF